MASRARFKKSVLENGLTLVSERNPGFQSLSIGVWVRTGTRHETEREAGISHFLEHMLFKGTKTRTALEIAREVDRVGGEFNAFTTREHTCFHILVLKRDLDLAIDILSDVVLNSDFASEEFERERKVILQEIAMVDEAPEELVHDLYWEQAYGSHPLGKPILGSAASIRRLRRADVLGFFRKHYRPEQMIVSVAGDVDHATVRSKIRSGLARHAWPGRATRAPKPAPASSSETPHLSAGRWWNVRKKAEQLHLVWGVEAPRYSSPDRYALNLVNVYLGGGMSSTLFQEIREKRGLAYTVYSTISPFVDSGVFSVYAATQPGKAAVCVKLIEECLNQVREKLLSKHELQSVQDNLKGTLLLISDNVESRMNGLARNELFYEPYLSVEELCRRVQAVTAEEFRRVARRYLDPARASLLALGPEGPRGAERKLGARPLR